MNNQLLQTWATHRLSLKPGEELLFSKKMERFLRSGVHWFLTSQRLFTIEKEGVQQKALYFPEEQVVAHETGEQNFTGNVQLLTNQRVIVLEVGAKDFLIESIPLSQIVKLDITALTEKLGHSFVYGFRFYLKNNEVIEVQHGKITTSGIYEQKMTRLENQQLHERFPRKICDLAGLKFSPPQLRRSMDRISTVDFYSKSDLSWPQMCAACLQTEEPYVFDEYTVDNYWYEAGYSFEEGLIPEITYKIPYCSSCFINRFGSGMVNRAVQSGQAGSNGARVELCFENPLYAREFIQLNSM